MDRPLHYQDLAIQANGRHGLIASYPECRIYRCDHHGYLVIPGDDHNPPQEVANLPSAHAVCHQIALLSTPTEHLQAFKGYLIDRHHHHGDHGPPV